MTGDSPTKPRLRERFANICRTRHLSLSTERGYWAWVCRFVKYHSVRQEIELVTDAEQKFSDFISSIAPLVAASTQNQAWNALVFLYRDVLKHEMGDIPNAMRAKRAGRIRPVPCDHAEALSVVQAVSGTPGLALRLIYGTAMRIKECLRLRLKDFDFDNNQISIYDGKSGDDFIPLPLGLRDELLELVNRRTAEHLADKLDGKGWVHLPESLGKKYPKWHFKSDWQYAFASAQFSFDPRTSNIGRHHLSPEGLQQAMAASCRKLGIRRRFTPASLRHAGARFAEKNGTPISEIQRWLRHKDVETTLRYLGKDEHRPATVKGPFG